MVHQACNASQSQSAHPPAGDAEVASAQLALEQQQLLVCLHLTQLGHKLGGLPGDSSSSSS
jgi:hypothetical protein